MNRKLLIAFGLIMLLVSSSAFIGTTQKALNYVFISPPKDATFDSITATDGNFDSLKTENFFVENQVTITKTDINVEGDANFQDIGVAGNIFGDDSTLIVGDRIQCDDCDASGTGAVALGKDSTATNSYSVAMGQLSVASGLWSIAIGIISEATGSSSVSLGRSDSRTSPPSLGASRLEHTTTYSAHMVLQEDMATTSMEILALH